MDFNAPQQLTPYQLAFLSMFHEWGGVSIGFYACAYHSIGLIDEATWNRDVQDVMNFKKNSLDAKECHLTLAIIPMGMN